MKNIEIQKHSLQNGLMKTHYGLLYITKYKLWHESVQQRSTITLRVYPHYRNQMTKSKELRIKVLIFFGKSNKILQL